MEARAIALSFFVGEPPAVFSGDTSLSTGTSAAVFGLKKPFKLLCPFVVDPDLVRFKVLDVVAGGAGLFLSFGVTWKASPSVGIEADGLAFCVESKLSSNAGVVTYVSTTVPGFGLLGGRLTVNMSLMLLRLSNSGISFPENAGISLTEYSLSLLPLLNVPDAFVMSRIFVTVPSISTSSLITA